MKGYGREGKTRESSPASGRDLEFSALNCYCQNGLVAVLLLGFVPTASLTSRSRRLHIRPYVPKLIVLP